MQIDDALLEKLEHLSALKIPKSECDEVKKSLSEVLQFSEILSELDTSAVAASEAEFSPLREDEARKSGVISDVLAHAPQIDGRFFSVPKIIE